MTAPLKVALEAEGRLLSLALNRPKANLIDAAMIAALTGALAEHLDAANLAAVLLEAEGPNFSFGASVEEHLPDRCAQLLHALHGLIVNLVASPVPILVAVRGRCLGGGLELALAGHLMFVAPDATLGQPEIRLGVFAPAASCLLPELASPMRAADLLLSGRDIAGVEAVAMGIAKQATIDPAGAARGYVHEHLLGKSASALRYAVRAARCDYVARIKAKLKTAEQMYLTELMATHDAREGLDAFIAKRSPQWKHC